MHGPLNHSSRMDTECAGPLCLTSSRSEVVAHIFGQFAEMTNLDAQRPASFDISVGQESSGTLLGETLSAATVNAVNTIEAPGNMTPKPVSAHVKNGRVSLQVPPASVTVVTTRPRMSQ